MPSGSGMRTDSIVASAAATTAGDGWWRHAYTARATPGSRTPVQSSSARTVAASSSPCRASNSALRVAGIRNASGASSGSSQRLLSTWWKA